MKEEEGRTKANGREEIREENSTGRNDELDELRVGTQEGHAKMVPGVLSSPDT